MRGRLELLALAAAVQLTAGSAPGRAAAAPALGFPVACTIGQGCEVQHYVDLDPGPGVRDYRGGRRTYDGHNGVDIRIADMAAQRRGVDVLAAAAGKVLRVRGGIADISVRATGLAQVAGRECGNGVVIDHGDGLQTQYCHLALGSLKVAAGQSVAAGQAIGRIGVSGQTEFPHLHLSVRRNGAVVDPFAPAPGAGPLWTPEALKAMGYKQGAILNLGFAAGPVSMEAVESGAVAPPGADPAALVVFGRAIELEVGDEVEIRLLGPGGAVLAQSRTPLDRDKAQYLVFVGRKRPAAGWPQGGYRADYTVHRRGRPVLSRSVGLRL